MKGILKSRPVTPDPASTVGEKSKELADKALNLINPGRQIYASNFPKLILKGPCTGRKKIDIWRI